MKQARRCTLKRHIFRPISSWLLLDTSGSARPSTRLRSLARRILRRVSRWLLGWLVHGDPVQHRATVHVLARLRVNLNLDVVQFPGKLQKLAETRFRVRCDEVPQGTSLADCL